MVRIRISSRERELLEKAFQNKSCPFDFLIEDLEVVLEDNSRDKLELIIDNITDYFVSKGLLQNDEPNELGFELENLNAKFIRELQKINDLDIKKPKSIFKKRK